MPGFEVIVEEGQDPSHGTGRTGIECFLENLEHELKHIKIFQELWPAGYIHSQDSDNDGYPDLWEVDPMGGAPYDFDPNETDVVSVNYSWNLVGENAATRFEEQTCRDHQESIIIPESIIKNDWSFDKEKNNDKNVHQGKNW